MTDTQRHPFDWRAAIERNREALLRIVETLFAMAGVTEGSAAAILPRHLRNHVLRILRPAESAARRLIVIAARDVKVMLRVVDGEKRKRSSARPLSPLEGEMSPKATEGVRRPRAHNPLCHVVTSPPQGGRKKPCVTGIVYPPGDHPDGQTPVPAALPLIDPRKRFDLQSRRRYATTVPRVRSLSDTALPVYMRQPDPPARHVPGPNDELDAIRICRRLAALKRALDNIDAHARRLARMEARRKAGLLRTRHYEPMRPGWPPGRRKRRIHEVDDILRECHSLAVWAMKPPDTG